MRSRRYGVTPQARNYSPLAFPDNYGGDYGQTSPGSSFVRLPPADILPRAYRGPMPAGVPFQAPPVQPYVDASRFVTFQSFPFSLADQESRVILNRPTTTRVYLFIINTTVISPVVSPPSNAIRIAFDREPTGTDLPLFENGGAFEWLYSIPQNTIFASNSEGVTLTGVVVFAELDPCAVNCDTINTYNAQNGRSSIPDCGPMPEPMQAIESEPEPMQAISPLAPASVQPAPVTAPAGPPGPQMFVVNDAHQLIPVSSGGQPAQFWRDRGYQVWGAPTVGGGPQPGTQTGWSHRIPVGTAWRRD